MKKLLAMTLAVLMILSVLPVSVFAASRNSSTLGGVGFTVTSDKESVLAPGVAMNELVVFDNANRRVEMYLTTVDTTVDTVSVYANYKDNQNATLGMQTVRDQAAAMEKNYPQPFKIVAAINASYYNTATGKPTGAFVMEGKDITTESEGNAYPFFAVMKDGTYFIGAKNEYSSYKGQIKEAIGGYVHLVKDGEVCAGLDKTALYPRQTIGLTADGKIILLTADGINEPKTYGITVQKQAEIMKAMGCVEALHLDGGSSATFLAKREGSDTLDCVNSPSGGYERSVSNTLMIVSTAVADGNFDHAVLTAANSYVTPNSTVAINAVGVDVSGASADIPAEVTYALADSSYGTVSADGVFTSNGTIGDAEIKMMLGEKEVGSVTVHVVHPTSISFTSTDLVVPYGKSISLSVNAKYGDYDVAILQNDIEYSVSNSAIGTVNGNTFTAAGESATVTSSTLVAKYKANNAVTASVPLSLGKGSEVVEDYESYSAGEKIYTFKQVHSCGAGDSYVQVVDSTTGKVRNGDKALAIHIDGNEYHAYDGFSQNRVSDLNKDNLSAKATAIGAWVYIPEDAPIGLALGIRFYRSGTASSNVTTVYPISAGDLSVLEAPGWYYFSADISDASMNFDFHLFSFEIFLYEETSNDYDINLLKQYNMLNEFTLYVDDITLDYSQAVDDREVPEFDDIKLETVTSEVAMKNQTVAYNTFGVYVQARDHVANNAVGLDLSTAKAYVDGVDATSKLTVGANGMLSLAEASYSEGAHSFKFEIADNNGNTAAITRFVTVNASDSNAVVSVVPHDPEATELPVGSEYWIDVKTAEIEKVSKIVTTLKMDGVNNWVLDFMKVTDGFTVDAVLDETTNDVTLTIERTDYVSQKGEGVVVSIPIHTWEYKQYYNNTTPIDPAVTPIDYDYHNTWARAIDISADSGVVTFIDGAEDTFAVAPFRVVSEVTVEVNYQVWSESISARYHIHKAVAAPDKAPTCTEVGYTGRTVCVGCYCRATQHTNGVACTADTGCGSPVNWGTAIPALGHHYETINGKLQCKDCEKAYNGTSDGKYYIDGVLAEGWVESSYYANGEKLLGINKVQAPDASGEFYYDFGENGTCANAAKYTGVFFDNTANAYRYSLAGTLAGGWQNLSGDWYYFEPTAMTAVSGNVEINGITYSFEANGKLTKGVWAKTLYGTRYYNGPTAHRSGWLNIDGKDYCFDEYVRLEGGYQCVLENLINARWYYFNEDGTCDKTAVVPDGFYTDRNGLGYSKDGIGLQGLQLIDGSYYFFNYKGYAQKGNNVGRLFGDDYKAVTGLIEVNGELCYYEDGRPKMAGLIEVDGSYYFAGGSKGQVAVGKQYVWQGNDILPNDTYEFAADGKLLNGIVEKDGTYYYYNMGKAGIFGLVEVDGSYYFASGKNGEVATGKQYVWQGNGILPNDTYEFAADGKMLNGIVDKDGTLCYYENGKPKMAGLIEVDGDYYFAYGKNGEVATGKQYVWKTNGIELENANCEFGADGKLLNGIVNKNGTLCYYVMGLPKMAGLIEIDGDYYFASGKNGELAIGKQYVWKTNGIKLDNLNCEFGSDGKLLNGLITKEGKTYYYEMGCPKMAGLIEVDGDYYFINGKDGSIATGSVYVWNGNGILENDTYEFGADGKLLDGFITKGSTLYYYESGKYGKVGLNYIDGDYYFVDYGGKVWTDGTYYVWQTNGLSIKMVYSFDKDGKVIR